MCGARASEGNSLDPAQFFAASRVVIVAGKGGVGKTTVSAGLARAAARTGLSALIIEVEGKSGLASLFGQPPFDYAEVVLSPGGGRDGAADVSARTLTPDDALLEYLQDHGMNRISKRLASSGAVDMVATAAPGIKDILILGKVKQLEQRRRADLIVLDAPAAGHAISFLRSARGLLDAVKVGPINTQARDVLDLLTDPARCQVVLVTLPEETPVNELVETAYSLEDEVGVSLGPVVVNGLYPAVPGLDQDPTVAAVEAGAALKAGEGDSLAAAAAFRRRRMDLQAEEVARLADRLPLPQLSLPYLFEADLGPAQVELLAQHLLDGIGALDDLDGGLDVSNRSNPGAKAGPKHRARQQAELRRLVAEQEVIVCTGSGGVGKTTTAAVMALEAAQQGRNACVVTIDPAKRLADALGLAELSNTPTRIEGPWPGELWALMLDTKSTFDDLVQANAESPEQAEGILANRFYRNISGALSGTQEYMAMEKLYELHQSTDFDLVVVDTPPTRNALDFLEAPRRLTRFLDHRLFRVLMAPTRGVARAVNVAAQAFLRTVSKVVGGEVVRDAMAFFSAFDGMEEGFRDRAAATLDLLSDDVTAFVLVAAPRGDVVAEATYFAERLHEADIPVRALVVNRMHPRFTEASPASLQHRAESLAGTDVGGLFANLAEFAQVAADEERHLSGLTERVAPAPVVRVPFLDTDVHDLDGLAEIGRWLFGT